MAIAPTLWIGAMTGNSPYMPTNMDILRKFWQNVAIAIGTELNFSMDALAVTVTNRALKS